MNYRLDDALAVLSKRTTLNSVRAGTLVAERKGSGRWGVEGERGGGGTESGRVCEWDVVGGGGCRRWAREKKSHPLSNTPDHTLPLAFRGHMG